MLFMLLHLQLVFLKKFIESLKNYFGATKKKAKVTTGRNKWMCVFLLVKGVLDSGPCLMYQNLCLQIFGGSLELKIRCGLIYVD